MATTSPTKKAAKKVAKKTSAKAAQDPFYAALKAPKHSFTAEGAKSLFAALDKGRVRLVTESLTKYIAKNLPKAVERRSGLSDYRTNPYVLMTTASLLDLADPSSFAKFLFHNKLYMGLETSFGKSIENELVKLYPIDVDARSKWSDAEEKLKEQAGLKGLSKEAKARERISSVWREIDKSCVLSDRRVLTSIKSGPNCINDTQVAGMANAIASNYQEWWKSTKKNHPNVQRLDVVVGLTYGTDRTTNNKENQILAKLLESGFVEEDRNQSPGVLIDQASRKVRVYRRIGRDFWAMIGDPAAPESAGQVFLEILIGLARALSKGIAEADIETKMNVRMLALSDALRAMTFPAETIPTWVKNEMTDDERFWFHAAMSAFYDEGI